MPRRALVAYALAGALAAAPRPAAAQSREYAAALAPELPGAPARGFARLTLVGAQLAVRLDFAGIPEPGASGGAIGLGASGPSIVLLDFPFGATAASYAATFDLTAPTSYYPRWLARFGGDVAAARAALIRDLGAGLGYVAVTAPVGPTGTLRGSLATVPEPSTLVLLGVGLVAATAVRERRAPPRG